MQNVVLMQLFTLGFNLRLNGRSRMLAVEFPETRVCGKDYSRHLVWRKELGKCESLPEAMSSGSRARPGAPFDLGADCGVKWFTPEEACDLIGSAGKLVFQGDSLIRQLNVAMVSVLSGNYRSGGINMYTPPKYWEYCQCEHQYQCYAKPVNHRLLSSSAPQFTICPKWTRNHLVGTDSYSDTYNDSVRLSPDQKVVIADASALHKSLDFETAAGVFERTYNELQPNGTLIPMTINWPGPNKPEKFIETQGIKAVEHYNTKLKDWAKEKNDAWVLDSYTYTRGEYSRDGVHYDDLNVGLAQLLLNYIARLQGKGALSKLPEEMPNDPTNFKAGTPDQVGIEVYRGPHPPPQNSFGDQSLTRRKDEHEK